MLLRCLEALFRLADLMERRVPAATAPAERLTQARVPARAGGWGVAAAAAKARAPVRADGELVPSKAELARREGREYEAAAALLERIRGEREVWTPRPTHRRVTGSVS